MKTKHLKLLTVVSLFALLLSNTIRNALLLDLRFAYAEVKTFPVMRDGTEVTMASSQRTQVISYYLSDLYSHYPGYSGTTICNQMGLPTTVDYQVVEDWCETVSETWRLCCRDDVGVFVIGPNVVQKLPIIPDRMEFD